MKRVYIAGPMSGLPGLNFPAFNAEAARLRALGYVVINPAEINDGAPALPFSSMTPAEQRAHWRSAMKADIAMMLNCDAIALLPGWESSRGAQLEKRIADELGMKVCMATHIFDECEQLTPDQAILLRARHWVNTAAGIEAAQGPDAKREAILAHETMGKLLRDAVDAAALEGGAA